MNKPIISPIIFYLIDVSDVIKYITGAICAGLTFALIIFIINFFDNSYKQKKEKQETSKHNIKLLIVPWILTLIISTLTPSANVIYKMLVASQITPQNIEIIGDTVEYSVDYIFNKIQSLNSPQEFKEE